MRGGPADGSERDITGKECVLLALIHYWLSFLIRDGGRGGVAFDKAGLLSVAATVPNYICPSGSINRHYNFFPFSRLFFFVQPSPSGRTVHVMLISMLLAL